MSETEIKKNVADAGRYMLEKGLVHGTAGNISARIDEKRIAITPSSVPYSLIKVDSVLIVDMKGKVLDGELKPSSEMKMHLEIYKARPDVNAIIHTHSIYATAIAACRKNIPAFLDEMSVLGGPIVCSKYAVPGSMELARNVVKVLRNRNAALIANHGAVACGQDIENALYNAELIEEVAMIYVLSKIIEGPVELPSLRSNY